MAETSEASGSPFPNEQAVLGRYNQLRNEMSQVFAKYTELEMEMNEHELVIKAIEPMDSSRRCFRLIGGVLVERTVGEVLPAVIKNKDNLKEVLQRLQANLQTKKKEIAQFEAQYKIRVRRADESEAVAKETSSQGVLVSSS